jgi:hypothetical protein
MVRIQPEKIVSTFAEVDLDCILATFAQLHHTEPHDLPSPSLQGDGDHDGQSHADN